MKYLRHFLFVQWFVCGLAVMANAQHLYYQPNNMVSPVLKQKHSAGLGVLASRGIAFQSWEIQGYYALTKRWVATGAYHQIGKNAVLQNVKPGANYRFGEIGIGVYEPLSKGTASLVAGYGRGFLYNYYKGEEASEFNISRWFLNTNLSYRSGHFQGGFDMRLVYLRYDNGIVPIAIDENQLQIIQRLERNGAFLMPEIGVNAGMWLKPVYICFSIATIYRRTDSFGFSRTNSSIKLMLELDRIGGKKKAG